MFVLCHMMCVCVCVLCRYVYLYEKITGEQFQVPDITTPINARIDKAVRAALGL